MDKPKHTPGPYRVINSEADNRLHIAGKVGNIATLPLFAAPDVVAATGVFIVRAVNCHDDLLAALKDIRQEAELAQGEWVGVNADYSPEWTWPFKAISIKADESIAKAEAP